MIICVSGLSGSGKNTVGGLIAEKLKLRKVQFSFKDDAKDKGVSLMEFQKLASENARIDNNMDEKIVDEADKGNCVVTTWLGPWMVKKADLKVWLDVPEGERARRVAGREKINYEEALKHVRERDANNRERYTKYYGINIDEHRLFDLVIDAEKKTPDEIVAIIMETVKKKGHA